MWNGGTQAHNPHYSFDLAGSLRTGGKDAHLNLLMQQPPPPPSSTSLQQLLLSHLQQQQKQQQEAQEISVALNATVTVLLNKLRSLQYATDNPQPRRRLYVCGLRESCKAIKAGTALAVLLAPDIQLNTSSSSSSSSSFGRPNNVKADRVLDGRMREIMCSSGRVPVVFALSRKKIGQVFGSKKRMSAITLLDVGEVEGLLGAVLALAEEGRQHWVQMQRVAVF
ncbi:hypothetical protein OEZ86_001058 [Tetradesmus obliquus]|nr:hypothetical protein OEZ86_001058 [Tetradesmus obliquus]